jgi:CRP-like cAMP-binding protein
MGKAKSGDTGAHSGLGPSIAAVALWGSSKGQKAQLFTEEERARLSLIASIARFKKGAQIYREGTHADAMFTIVSGVVKVCKTAPDGTDHVGAFLFPDDLFGLAEEGKYASSARAITDVTLYRLPVSALENRLRRDAGLDFQVICKLCHELRQAQRHAFILSRRNAVAKLAMFCQLLEEYQAARGGTAGELYLPMSRSDVADYVGLSPEAVSRSFRALASRGVITLRNKYLRIKDRAQLEALVATDPLAERPLHLRP